MTAASTSATRFHFPASYPQDVKDPSYLNRVVAGALGCCDASERIKALIIQHQVLPVLKALDTVELTHDNRNHILQQYEEIATAEPHNTQPEVILACLAGSIRFSNTFIRESNYTVLQRISGKLNTQPEDTQQVIQKVLECFRQNGASC